MAKIAIRFNRVAAVFDEVTRASRLCQSSGSEHSADDERLGSPIDLSDLVASFMEREGEEGIYLEDDATERDDNTTTNGDECSCLDADEARNRLSNLLDASKNYAGERISSEVEAAMDAIKDKSSVRDYKRQLMTILREKGFDAGLCKTRWEKTARFPAGEYQYIDIKLLDGTRFIVEPFLVGSFQIARPTSGYASSLGLFPRAYVGRPEELKEVVRLMCTAIKRSMKSTELSIPPWRKNTYMQAKWFGSYRRTTNKVRSKERPVAGEMSRAVGFEALPGISYQCRENFECKNLLRVGYLTAAFSGN